MELNINLSFLIAVVIISTINFNSCYISNTSCKISDICGECGICLTNATSKDTYCETKFFNNLFILTPPSCPIKDHCSNLYRRKSNCLNGGICRRIFGGYVCKCKPFYHGQHCELRNYYRQKFVQDIIVVYSSMQKALIYQVCLIVVKEFGDGFILLFNTGGGESLIYSRSIFQFNSPKKYCLEYYGLSYQMCRILPKENQYFLPLNLSYPVTKVDEKSEKILDNKTTVFGSVRRFSVAIYNNLIKEFHQNFTKVVLYPEKSITDCTPEILLYNCGEDSTTAPQYFWNSSWTIISTFDTKTDCVMESNILCAWKIWKLELNHDEIETKPLITFKGSNIFQYRILSFTLKPGLYKVQLLVGAESKKIPKLLNFANCYFEMKLLPLEVVIEGGVYRTAFMNKSLIFNASQTYDPNQQAGMKHSLLFSWNCTSVDSFCTTKTTREKIFVVKGPFEIGRTYTFNLKVWSDNLDIIPVFKTQEVFIEGSVKEVIIIKCLRNCGKNNTVNPKKIIYLEAHGQSDNYTDHVHFTWAYTENNGPLFLADRIKQTGVRSNILIIKPNVLNEDSFYTFTVTGLRAQDKESIVLYVKKWPSYGNCFILPKQGIVASTLFNISTDFSDTSYNKDLTFMFYEKNVNENFHGILLGSNRNGVLKNVKLTENVLIVRIIKNNLIYAEQNCSVELRRKERPLNITYSLLKDVSSSENSGSVSDQIQTVSAFASDIELVQDKLALVQKLIQLIPEKSVHDFTELTMSLAVLKKVIVKGTDGKDDWLDQISVRGTTSRLMNNLLTKLVHSILNNPALGSEAVGTEIQETAHSLLICADAVVCSRGFKSQVSNETQTIEKMSEISISIQDHKVSLLVLSALNKMSQVVTYSLLPSEQETVVKSEKFGLWVKVDAPKELSDVKISPHSNRSSVSLSKSLAKSLANISECIILQVILMKVNPYRFDYKALSVNTEVLSVNIKNRKLSNITFSIKNLSKPIDLYFKVLYTNSTAISSSAILPYPKIEPDQKDFAVTVYKIEPPPYLGNCKLFVIFHGLETNRSLRVIVLHRMRPDFDMMISESYSVTNSSPVYTKSFQNVDFNDLFYLGIIPGEESQPGDIILFKFEVHYVQCLTRFRNKWINRKCIVGENTTPFEIHCQCQHLSVFGGGFIIPPKKVDPILDIYLFLKVKENPYAVILVVSVLVFYLILLLWTKHKDNKDILQRTVIVLEDNYPGEEWSYLVTVYTGCWIGAGTDAKVALQLFGTMGKSRVHVLQSSKRKVLKRHCDDWFLVFTPQSIGVITKLHIWHDCTGKKSDWYCSKVIVYDLLMNRDYYFPCGLWFSLKEENEYPEAVLYPLDSTKVSRRVKLAVDNTLFGFRETHLLVSILMRHPRSSFTRSQRLSTIIGLIMITMLTSIMFYGVLDDTGTEFPIYSVPKMRIIVIMESQILSQPFLFLMLFCFKKSRVIADPKKKEFEHKMEEWAFYQEQKKIELELIQRKNKENKKTDKRSKPLKQEYIEEVAIDEEDEEEEEDEIPEKDKKMGCCQIAQYYCRNLFHKIVVSKPLMPIRITEETPDSAVIRNRWTVVAWTICQAHIWLCGYFVMLYGLKLDEEGARDWIRTFFMAIFGKLFFLSSLKIIIFATILAVLFGKLYNVETFDCKPADAVFLDAFGDPEYLDNLINIRSQPQYHPLPRKTVQEIRESRKLIRTWKIIIDFGMLFTFFCVLFSSIFSWPPKYYRGNKHITESVTSTNLFSPSLQSVHNLTDFHAYLYETLAANVFTSTWYNEDELSAFSVYYKSMGWLRDSVSRLVGTPRMRQQRIKDDICSVQPPLNFLIKECRPALDSGTEDKKSYSESWVEMDDDYIDQQFGKWSYVKRYQSGSMGYYGGTGQYYDSGGYIIELGRTMEYYVDSVALLDSQEDTWLDEYTRVVIIEMTFYNPNVDFFYVGAVIAERLPSGAVVATFQNDIVNIMILKWNNIGVLFVILVLYFMCRICFSFNKQGFNFFSKLHSYYEILFIFLILTILGLYLNLIFMRSKLIGDLERNGQEAYISFRNIIAARTWIDSAIACLLVVTAVRVLRGIKLGRHYESLKFTFLLSLHSLCILILPLILLIVLSVNTITFLLNMPLQPSYRLITYRTTFRDLNKTSLFQQMKFFPFLLCFISTITMAFYMAILCHCYKVAKFYGLSSALDFNFISFVYQQIKQANILFNEYLKRKNSLRNKEKTDVMKGEKIQRRKCSNNKLYVKSRLRGGSGCDISGYSRPNLNQNFNYLISHLDLILTRLSDLDEAY